MDHIVLHIPHSSTQIPLLDGYQVDHLQLKNEINRLTDWYTEEIFNIPIVDKVIAGFSRIFCDVERFSDDTQEVMAAKGMGFAYTHGTDGHIIREVSEELRNKILHGYYQPHHQALTDLVTSKLEKYGKVLIIDCHSFPNVPLPCDLNQQTPRPLISIGTDKVHTPALMIEKLLQELVHYSIKVNDPYAGTMVPLAFYGDKRVQSIMIEINRSMYLRDDDSEQGNIPSKRSDFYKTKALAQRIIHLLAAL